LRIVPDVYHVAFIRTLSICAVALALAFAGVRLRRPELTRIAYAAVAFVAAKLIFEDLRHGHLEFIAASLFLFAITLIVVPRLARMGQKE
jgi:predicted tellurium resistance membrane protein TerC